MLTAAALLFADFIRNYNKQYPSVQHHDHALECFSRNLKFAERLNSLPDQTALYGINPFSDLCDYDFRIYHNSHTARNNGPEVAVPVTLIRTAFNRSIDWRLRGAVSRVKDQGQCASCWAFAATGLIESANFVATGEMTSLSEQRLVSCSNNSGCSGGSVDTALQWLATTGTVEDGEAFPYDAQAGLVAGCQPPAGHSPAVVSSLLQVPSNEDKMAAWILQNGPIATTVDASQWQHYTSGIVTLCHGRRLDHGVLIVGFTPDYWIVKNSWGPLWGEGGYIRLHRGSNQCGLTTSPVAVKVAKADCTATGQISKLDCAELTCTQNCTQTVSPIGECTIAKEGSQSLCSLSPSTVQLRQHTTADCSGAHRTQQVPLGQCFKGHNGGWHKYQRSTSVL